MTTETKLLKVQKLENGRIFEIEVQGKLSKEDYEAFIPELEQAIAEHGKVRILFEMHDFEGWSAGALWSDTKFDARHFNDIERLALVGESQWQKGMALFCRPFTTAKVRYFDRSHVDEARRWIAQ